MSVFDPDIFDHAIFDVEAEATAETPTVSSGWTVISGGWTTPAASQSQWSGSTISRGGIWTRTRPANGTW